MKSYVTTTIEAKLDKIIEVLSCSTCNQDPDYEYIQMPPVCVDDTWQYVVVIFAQGAELSRTHVDTEISCDDPPPSPIDFELKDLERCDPTTATIWKRTVAFYMSDPQDLNSLTSVEVVAEYDTGITCNNVDHIEVPLCYNP